MCDRDQICKDEEQSLEGERLNDETIYHGLILFLIKKALIEKEGDTLDMETMSSIPRKDARGNKGLYDMDYERFFKIEFPCKVYWGNGRYYKVFKNTENARELLEYKKVLNVVGEGLKEYFSFRMKQEQSDKSNKNGEGTDRVFVRNPNMVDEYINAGIRYNITYLQVFTDAPRNGLLEKWLEILQMDKEIIDKVMLDIKIEDEVSITVDNRQIVIAKKQEESETREQSFWKLTYEFLSIIHEKLLYLDSAKIDYGPYTQVLNIIDRFCMETAGKQKAAKVEKDSTILRDTNDDEKTFILDSYLNRISKVDLNYIIHLNRINKGEKKIMGFMYQLGFLYKRLYTRHSITVREYYNEISNIGFQNWKGTIAEILEKGNAGDKGIDMNDFIPATCEVLLSENEVREQINNLEYIIQSIMNRLNENRDAADQEKPGPQVVINRLLKALDDCWSSEYLAFNPFAMLVYYDYCLGIQARGGIQIYQLLRAYQLLLQIGAVDRPRDDENVDFNKRTTFYTHIQERFNILENGDVESKHLLNLCDEINYYHSLIAASLNHNPIDVAIEARPGQDESLPLYYEQIGTSEDGEPETIYHTAGMNTEVQQRASQGWIESECVKILGKIQEKEKKESTTLWGRIKRQISDNNIEDMNITLQAVQDRLSLIDNRFSEYLRTVVQNAYSANNENIERMR